MSVAWLLQERALPREVAAQPCKVLVVEGTPPRAIAAMRSVAALMRASQVSSHIQAACFATRTSMEVA